jgi:NADH:ubiquinone oxidoreductase subunit 6 (subunit J)
MKASKGVHRLALLLGAVASTLWLFFVMVDTKGFQEVKTGGHWVVLFISTGICFFIPFLLVHGIAWVIRGFREDK